MYLEQQKANDLIASQYLDTTVTKFLDNHDELAVSKYLNGPTSRNENDISVTKFLDQ